MREIPKTIKTIIIALGCLSSFYAFGELLRLMSVLNDSITDPPWEFLVITFGIFFAILVFLDHFTKGDLLVE